MNVLSDSESSDSDTGRRFKTESTRCKSHIRVRRRSDESKSRLKHGERSRHDNSRSSPARRRTRSPADHRDGHKRRHRSKSRSKSRETNTNRKRHTKERSRSRSRGKDKRNKDEKQSKHEPNSSPRKRQKSPRHKSNSSKKGDKDRGDSKKNAPKLSDKRDKHVNHNKSKERHGKEEKTNDECQQRTKRSTSKQPPNQPPAIDTSEPNNKTDEHDNRDDNATDANLLCGPSLPPHMVNAQSSQCIEPTKSKTPEPSPELKKVYGPSMPSDFLLNRPASPELEENAVVDASIVDISASEDDDFVGPVPVDHEKSEAHLKLEKRALELKLAKLTEKERRTDDTTREEWMLELPELRSVAGLGLTARQFRTKERDEIKDRSSWTETPRDREEKTRKGPATTENLAESVSQKAAKAHREKRDAEQEAIARKHKKKHKRDESLVEMHQKKLKKKSHKEPEKAERRPFSRDTDLKVNRFDEAQKKAVMKKAQLLDSRFGSGESKYL